MSKSVKRIVKNSFFQTFGAFGITGLNFVMMLSYARLLGPVDYGSLVTSQAQVLVWTLLVDLGLTSGLIGSLTSAEGGKTELARQGFRAFDLVLRVLVLRLAGAVVGATAIYFLARAQHEPGSALFWQDLAFTPHLFALGLQQTAIAFASYRHRQGYAVIANLIGMAVTVVLALWLAYRGESLAWLLLAQSWGGFLTSFLIFGYFGLHYFRRKRRGQSRRIERHPRGPWGISAWRALARDAWPYAIVFAVTVLWQRLDQIMATYLLGKESGGQYALAVRLVTIPVFVATSVSFALFPDLQRVGRDAPERVRLILGALGKLIYRYGILTVAALLALVGFGLVPLVPKFRPALELLPYFVPGIWAFWMHTFLVNALFGVRQYRAVVRAHLLSLLVYLPAVFCLPRFFDLYGVVASFNIFCFSLTFLTFRSAKHCGLLPASYSPFSAYTAAERDLWATLPATQGRKI